MTGSVTTACVVTREAEGRVWRAFVLSLLVHGFVVAGFWARPASQPRLERSELLFELREAAQPVVLPAPPPPPEEPPPKPEEPVAPPPPPPPKPEPEPVKPPPPKEPPVARKVVKPAPIVRRAEPVPAESTDVAPLPMSAPPVVPAPTASAPVEPVYRAMDLGAALAGNPRPDYPRSARRLGQEGLVMVRVEVSADGRAERVALQQSSGFEALDQAALDAVARWRFVAARRAGVPVAATVTVPIRFVLREG
ncbi:MAG: TonB family protein [Magnetococcales bacterium]|nr:TonB family protein [Magnetococcales bacterium]